MTEYLNGSPGGSWGGSHHAVPSNYPRPNHGDGRDRIHWATARCGTSVQVHTPPTEFILHPRRYPNQCGNCYRLLQRKEAS